MAQYIEGATARAIPTDETPAVAPRLLIVDDLADNRAILARRFQKRGFEIVEADCGRAALDTIARQPFDVVLLDVMMPDLDGVEVLRRIRHQHSQSELPVIMVTAKSQTEDVVQSLKLGANDYVTKPVDFAVALARVNAQIERKRADGQLRDANEALQGAKSDLERKVSERSARLVEANAVISQKVARRIASEDKIAHLAHHDTLTGLANRFTFDEEIKTARRRAEDSAEQLAVLFIDLDGFKNVNDTLGHAIGDGLLKEVARQLTDVVGAQDFCARLGGDEFAIIHVSQDVHTSAAALAQRVIGTVSGGFTVEGNRVYIGASVGIATLQGRGVDSATLLKQADLAMYRAKADGRGVYRFFESEMGLRVEMRRSLELDLRHAVENENFQLYYQPIVDIRARRVACFEALIRWHHPTRGYVPPSEFIALAEETGLIVPIGDWVMRRACQDAAHWPADIRVAINLSPVQFRGCNLAAKVMAAVRDADLEPRRLEIEVTESVFMGQNAPNMQTLNELRAFGVRISLDDFGTGYAGLGYFRAFQFDKVKIDQSFIQQMGRPGSLAIIRAAVGLGENLGICTTAEGVESADQLENLLSEGCNEVQGYLFSAPRPVESVPDILREIEQFRRLDDARPGD